MDGNTRIGQLIFLLDSSVTLGELRFENNGVDVDEGATRIFVDGNESLSRLRSSAI